MNTLTTDVSFSYLYSDPLTCNAFGNDFEGMMKMLGVDVDGRRRLGEIGKKS